MAKEKIKYQDIIEAEDELLRQRRAKIMGDAYAEALPENRFGIALSGGGIRSATINLGILKTLHKFGILKQADYLSTVSGGGYTGAYIQATQREEGQDGKLFHEEHLAYMRSRGEYLFPGTGWVKVWNQLKLIVSFIVSFLMSLISPAVLMTLVAGGYIYCNMNNLFTVSFADAFQAYWEIVGPWLPWLALTLFVVHYVFNVAEIYRLNGSDWLNQLQTAMVVLAITGLVIPLFNSAASLKTKTLLADFPLFVGAAFLLIILGFFTNPNATSFHRYYRKQLADAFLHFANQNKNIPIKDLCQPSSNNERDYLAPYPLINTCLNLQSSKDPNFQGAKASDYFLLSPLYCGAKLVGYVPTADTVGYKRMTLPAATTISAAAVNPGLGLYSNKLLSVLLTIFNLRLGFWINNPMKVKEGRSLVWWPFYFFYELLGRIGTDNRMVNISDGGHIENLGVMELLRRKCKLIISVDAGADPFFTFADLENLTIRARNELGIDLRFKSNQVPEDIMRVRPSHGYSRKRFAIAEMYQLWEKVTENGTEKVVHYPGGKKIGVFVYVKSTVTAPTGRPSISAAKDPLKYGTYKYKIYHPEFPHESTADQFFDPVQWESYFQLGQFIAADMLGCDNLNDFDVDEAFTIPNDELYRHFDTNMPLFGAVPLPIPSIRGGLEDEVMDAVLEQQQDVDGVAMAYEM